MLYGECLPHGGGALAQFVMEVEPSEDRVIALAEAFHWFRQRWRSEGAWDAIRHLPPSVLSSRGEGNDRDFAAVLFPFGPPQPSPRRPPYDKQDFWEWQVAQAREVSRRLHPEIPTATDKWLTLCEADPEWSHAVEMLAASYSDLVRLEAEMMPRPAWEVEAHWERSSAARRGHLECGHVEGIPECTGCESSDFEAFEAHWGWHPKKVWRKHFQSDEDDHPARRKPCPCCSARHDRRPVGTVSCAYCAEAWFWQSSEFLSRRWGGWSWQQRQLRFAARTSASSDPRVVEWERKAERTPGPGVRSGVELLRRTLLGTDPWDSDSVLDYQSGLRAVGTLYLPVHVLNTDLKRDVDARAQAILDALWNKVELRKPKSTGRTETRSANWDRYLGWLWQHRVDGVQLVDLETEVGERDAEGFVSLPAMSTGISRALAVLGSA